MDARPSPLSLKKVGSGRSEVSTVSGLLGLGGGEDQRSSLPSPSSSASSSMFEYFGWVYHLGVNSIGHEYCHLRFLFIRGKYVEMYKRDPHENPGIDAKLSLKRTSAADATNKELDSEVAPVMIDTSQLHGTLRTGKDDTDTNCWTSPSGTGFMIRGKNYLKDNSKVMGGDPLLKLIGVDWFKVDKTIDRIALHPRSLLQSEAGKKLPFVLVINLQVPAKPNYSLALYYAADRPAKPNSLFAQFVDGTDMFRDARFKLIPSIVEGYWMVKRAVGTKACLLGKAVTCKYFRQDNFLEIDVDIGSSSVARSVIGLVLGYVTSIVVDLAILIEGKEEAELPEYILGTVRLNRLRLDSAVHLKV
ncbi:hypothetical protein C1H46_020835 [Malus baccata]|uniref:Protein ENHANCED DISEASE RESISTANCE 2 C-terminal domain-containing protein n=1 Tax=Malus baccata TaxID=106549 RepID=A0A540M489_MALBA|nr:hypothetical protein C1H46_020835 [Malus baccata]